MKYLFLPLIIINLTVAENKWKLFELEITVVLTFLSLLIAIIIGLNNKKIKFYIYIFFFLYLFFGLLNYYLKSPFLYTIKYFSLFIIYTFAGYLLYRNELNLLCKQTSVFVVANFIVMFLQIAGVSDFLYIWDTSFLDDPLSSFNVSDVGIYKNIYLSETLFKGAEDLTYVIGQARPSGLTHNNNVLSYIILVGIAINFSRVNAEKINIFDIIINLTAIYSMSKLVIFGSIILYVMGLLFGFFSSRKRGLIMLILLLLSAISYRILFPGLLDLNFSDDAIMVSLMLRLVDLTNAIGVTHLFQSIQELQEMYIPSVGFEMGSGYTTYATILNNGLFIPLIGIFSFIIYMFIKKIKKYDDMHKKTYTSIFFVSVMSQFGVPMYSSPLFYIFIGISLTPLLDILNNKLHRDYYNLR
jgi:hypothetical protein